MKVALVVKRSLGEKAGNFRLIAESTAEAKEAGAELVVFPEAALTGLSNNDDPAHDLPLGEPIPGSGCNRLTALARECRIWLALGLLEREGGKLYDSALLIGPEGNPLLKYRRIQPQWHGKKADPDVYCEGTEMMAAVTPWGSAAFALCGDLFDDGIVGSIRQAAPDVVLWLAARNFPDGTIDRERWEAGEEKEYFARARLCACRVLMVNALDDPARESYPCFGSAFAMSSDGDVLARWPAGKEGILYADT